MRTADALIEEVIRSSEIPSAKRRAEVARELRAHMEELVANSRNAGKADEEIERLLTARFGDPNQMGRNFAWVYRRERAFRRLLVLPVSILAVASLLSISVLVIQAGLSMGLGTPLSRLWNPHHTLIETADILATVVAYLALLTLEHLFEQHRVPKALGLLTLIFAILVAVCRTAGVGASFLMFGFANAMVLRAIQSAVKGTAARLAAVSVCFGVCALWIWSRSEIAYSLASSLPGWVVMGVGYQIMTDLAPRVDRGIFNRLQEF